MWPAPGWRRRGADAASPQAQAVLPNAQAAAPRTRRRRRRLAWSMAGSAPTHRGPGTSGLSLNDREGWLELHSRAAPVASVQLEPLLAGVALARSVGWPAEFTVFGDAQTPLVDCEICGHNTQRHRALLQ